MEGQSRIQSSVRERKLLALSRAVGQDCCSPLHDLIDSVLPANQSSLYILVATPITRPPDGSILMCSRAARCCRAAKGRFQKVNSQTHDRHQRREEEVVVVEDTAAPHARGGVRSCVCGNTQEEADLA